MYIRTYIHASNICLLQADYYESSTWLTAEERAAAEVKERERRKRLQRNNNKKIKICFDVAGRYIDAIIHMYCWYSMLKSLTYSSGELQRSWKTRARGRGRGRGVMAQ